MLRILLIVILFTLTCSRSSDMDILNHIDNINTPQALLNAKMFSASDYYIDKKEVAFANAVGVSNRRKIDSLLTDGVNINSTGKDSVSFLCWAFIKFQRSSFKYLIEKGADVNTPLKGGNTITDFAKKQHDQFYIETIRARANQ